MKVHAGDNQDLFSIFGLSSESILEDKTRMSALNALKSPHKLPSRMNMFGFGSELAGGQIKRELGEDTAKLSGRGGLELSLDQSPLAAYMRSKFPSDAAHKFPSDLGHKFPSDGSHKFPGDVGHKFPGGAEHKDEGIDILKQMTLKFGGAGPMEREKKAGRPAGDSPLDLTKPRSPPLTYSLSSSRYVSLSSSHI